MSEKIKVLITAVGAPPGYNAAKALGSCPGISIVPVDASEYAFGLYRFNGVHSYVVPPAKREDEYVQALLRIAKRERARVILPCLEDEILVLSKRKTQFSKAGISLPIPEYEQVIQGTDKFRLNQIAERLGIPHPKTREIKKPDDISKNDLSFPVILKPKISHGGRGFVQVANRAELAQRAEELLGQYPALVLQEFVPGREGSILLCGLLYDCEGRLKASFLSRSLRTLYSFGGPAMVGEPIEDSPIRDWSVRIVEAIGPWVGPVNLEFKLHESKKIPYLLELNPRLWGYGSLPVFCGINFPYLTVKVALRKAFRAQHRYDLDKVMIRAYEDFSVEQKELKSVC